VPAMTRVAMRDFGDDATIDKAKSDIPDWRNFVSIDLSR
jgi:chemotaxis regulatin CheY-phosphate phosphatase CheZ